MKYAAENLSAAERDTCTAHIPQGFVARDRSQHARTDIVGESGRGKSREMINDLD